MSLNLNQLRSFALVVRLGGLGAAARASGISQPALSRALRDLERHVGVQLLVRGPRGLRPTPVGLSLFEHAQTIVAAEREAEQLLGAAAGTHSGVLHVGASTTIATYVLPRTIADFARRYPGIDVRLTAAHTRVLVQLLQRFQVDLALAEAPPNDPRVVASPWMQDDMVVIGAPDHRLAGARHIPAEALAPERFILREEGSGTREIVLNGLANAGLVPRASMAVDGTEVIKQLVSLGVGVAIVSQHAIADQLAARTLCVLDVPSLRVRRPFNELSLPARRLSTNADAFMKVLRSTTKGRPRASTSALRSR
jgi:DNA-binding transcriptional LysR family regulator